MNAVKGGTSANALSSPASMAPALAKLARVIDVSFKLLELKLEVDTPRAEVDQGDVVLWRAEEGLMPAFVVVFETAPGEGETRPYAAPVPGPDDEGSGNSLAEKKVLSGLARLGAIKIKENAAPGEYRYALVGRGVPPPSDYPFSIIIRQPQ